MLKRIISVICVLVLFVSFACLSVGAAGFDYADYQVYLTNNGEETIVTCIIPADLITCGLRNIEIWTEGFTFPLVADTVYDIYVDMLPERMSLSDIPDGTSFLYSFEYELSVPGGYSTPSLTSYVSYYGNSISYDIPSYHGPVETRTFSISGTFNRPSPLVTDVDLSLFMNGLVPLTDTTLTFLSHDLVLNMTLSSLYLLQQQSGRTNEILSEVEKQLADQGKTLDEVLESQKDTNDKLDDIINRPVSPEAPSGSDVFDDFDASENEIRDEAQSGLDAGLDIQNNVLDIFLQYSSAFAAAGAVFGLFSEIPFFASLLYISISIGIFGLLLNLSVEAGQSASQSADKDRKHTNRQIIKKSRRN